MANKSNRGPGRPAKFINLVNDRSFTLKELFALNGDTPQLTVRKRVLKLVEAGVLTRLNKTAKSGQRGKPASLFVATKILKDRQTQIEAEKSARLAKVEAVA